ncbi:hypothetical protein V6N13_024642 [Hibiscus sabdariffa]
MDIVDVVEQVLSAKWMVGRKNAFVVVRFGVASIGCWTELGLLVCVEKGVARVTSGEVLSRKLCKGSKFSQRA